MTALPSTPAQPVGSEPGFREVRPDPTATRTDVTAIGSIGSQLKDVFFDFDDDRIRPDQRAALEANAAELRRSPQARALVEGHCDERGTRGYNMALGERRAQNVKDFLTSLGIDPARIATISYGQDKPFARGHDEASWAQNRRAHLALADR